MREIKFRAWDIKNKRMVAVKMLGLDNDICIRVEDSNVSFGKEEMILMQYTNMKDKNGSRIFEGDKIKITLPNKGKYIIAEVMYFKQYAEYVLLNTNTIEHEFEPLGDYKSKHIEIIGNIYEDGGGNND